MYNTYIHNKKEWYNLLRRGACLMGNTTDSSFRELVKTFQKFTSAIKYASCIDNIDWTQISADI